MMNGNVDQAIESAISVHPNAHRGMPELSRFFGIVMGMFYREHGVPHFHAVYGERRISVEVDTLTVHGDFPPRAQCLVLEWAGRHRSE